MNKAFIHNQTFIGIFVTLLSFLFWGVAPVYWKALFDIDPSVITAYRVIFSFIFVVLVMIFTGEYRQIAEIWKDRNAVRLLFLCGIFIGVNWWIFIAAITSAHVLESSMGYYINPLMNALIGAIFFKEHLRTLQKLATLLMLIGVGYMIISSGVFPVYGIALALSFAVYGAFHKMVKVNVMHGMFFEMLALLIPSFIPFFLISERNNFFSEQAFTMFMIVLAGPITILPLVGYAMGVKRLRLITVGVLQYASPTVTFLLGVFFFKESLPLELFIVFAFIWAGVIIYLADGFLRSGLYNAALRRQK
jgi:chloramphenicol-sensitive protein RarD